MNKVGLLNDGRLKKKTGVKKIVQHSTTAIQKVVGHNPTQLVQTNLDHKQMESYRYRTGTVPYHTVPMFITLYKNKLRFFTKKMYVFVRL